MLKRTLHAAHILSRRDTPDGSVKSVTCADEEKDVVAAARQARRRAVARLPRVVVDAARGGAEVSHAEADAPQHRAAASAMRRLRTICLYPLTLFC